MVRVLATCAAVAAVAAVCGCSTDIGVNDFTYACQTHSDCGPGYECRSGEGCVRAAGRPDGGAHDAGVRRDAGGDAGRPEGDGGADAGHDTGSDAGADGGPHDGGFILRYSTTSNATAGDGASGRFLLKSATGWSTGPKRGAGGFALKQGQPFVGK